MIIKVTPEFGHLPREMAESFGNTHRLPYYFLLLVLDGVSEQEDPTSMYELAQLVGESINESAEPLMNPWNLVTDVSLARRMGFQAGIRTVFEAVQKGLL